MSSKQLIYIGPTIGGYRLVKYQIYLGGLPKHIDGVFQQMPQIKRLFVPVSELSKAEAEVRTQGTPLNKYYKLAMEV